MTALIREHFSTDVSALVKSKQTDDGDQNYLVQDCDLPRVEIAILELRVTSRFNS